MKNNFVGYSTQEIILNDEILEKNIVNYCLGAYPGVSHALFVNGDSMKNVNIVGSDNISSIIQKIGANTEDPYMVMFNRYLDSGVQTHYINEILKNVSLFQSFNPGHTDAFYLSTKAIDSLRKINIDIKYTKKIFDFIHEGTMDCYSFNPNLYTFRIEDSSSSSAIQSEKTSILKTDKIINFNQDLSRFFSSHLILFWVFLVFFICTICIIFLKTFKIGYLFC